MTSSDLWRAVDEETTRLRPGAKPAQRAGRQALFPQTAHAIALCAADVNYLQAQELRCGQGKNRARHKTSPTPRVEQLRRSVASTDTTTRTADATIQITRACATRFIGPRPDQQSVSLPTQPSAGGAVACRPQSGFLPME